MRSHRHLSHLRLRSSVRRLSRIFIVRMFTCNRSYRSVRGEHPDTPYHHSPLFRNPSVSTSDYDRPIQRHS